MYSIDPKTTIDLIERMKAARVGDYAKWQRLSGKIRKGRSLDADEINYFATFARIYKNSTITARSGILHVRLSKEDEKPKCMVCGEESAFYCNQNDAYFCGTHVIGHDENER